MREVNKSSLGKKFSSQVYLENVQLVLVPQVFDHETSYSLSYAIEHHHCYLQNRTIVCTFIVCFMHWGLYFQRYTINKALVFQKIYFMEILLKIYTAFIHMVCCGFIYKFVGFLFFFFTLFHPR